MLRLTLCEKKMGDFTFFLMNGRTVFLQNKKAGCTPAFYTKRFYVIHLFLHISHGSR